tara:strand:+ start:1753 stop:2178 length:426 start_codon:yes stop_codon:yes gene_type:complete
MNNFFLQLWILNLKANNRFWVSRMVHSDNAPIKVVLFGSFTLGGVLLLILSAISLALDQSVHIPKFIKVIIWVLICLFTLASIVYGWYKLEKCKDQAAREFDESAPKISIPFAITLLLSFLTIALLGVISLFFLTFGYGYL